MKEGIQKTKERVYGEATYIARTAKQTIGEKNNFYITLQQLESLLLRACPCECGDQAPYGFVPEAGCPVHDEN